MNYSIIYYKYYVFKKSKFGNFKMSRFADFDHFVDFGSLRLCRSTSTNTRQIRPPVSKVLFWDILRLTILQMKMCVPHNLEFWNLVCQNLGKVKLRNFETLFLKLWNFETLKICIFGTLKF